MTEDSVDYLLGTTDEELSRLGFQHDAWHAEAEKLWALGEFRQGQSLLDLGCGPGFATLDLAKITGPDGNVHAIDAAGNYLEFLRNKLSDCDINHVTLQQGDAGRLDLENASRDGIFARWLFCFLSDPAQAVAEAYRLLRPGGTIIIWDYFHYLSARFFPARDSLGKLFEAFEQSNNLRGGSYNIGGMLPAILVNHGFEIIAIEPMCKAIRPGTPLWQWFTLFMDGFTPGLVEEGILSEAEYQQIRQDFHDLEALPDTFLFPPPQVGIVARKPL